MGNGLFGGVMPMLEKSLDITAERHKLITSNIANEETPGYKARDIDFEAELKRQMTGSGGIGLKRTNSGHIQSPGGSSPMTVKIDNRPAPGLDGNNVSLEREMVKMSENSLRHETSINLMVKKFEVLKAVISGR